MAGSSVLLIAAAVIAVLVAFGLASFGVQASRENPRDRERS